MALTPASSIRVAIMLMAASTCVKAQAAQRAAGICADHGNELEGADLSWFAPSDGHMVHLQKFFYGEASESPCSPLSRCHT